MAEYTEAKFRLFRCQDEGDLAVLGADLHDPAQGFNLRARRVWVRESERFPQSGLPGAHNKFNEEAAWQACRFFGVSEANAARAVARFKPLPHRLELVRERCGVLYVNDSKCTTVSSLKVALQAFDRPLRLLCGGKFKSREHFETAWQGLAPISWHPVLEEAVRALAASAQVGDVVLLAPATSSFDLYDNYMARGDDFKRIVSKLA